MARHTLSRSDFPADSIEHQTPPVFCYVAKAEDKIIRQTETPQLPRQGSGLLVALGTSIASYLALSRIYESVSEKYGAS
jgi:hypothetical protein